MIKAGLERMAQDRQYHKWPPAALEFRALCLPRGEDLGLPTEGEAFSQAVGNGSEKCPAVVFTLRSMGDEAFTLRRLDSDKARRLWSRFWGRTVEHVMAGKEVPEPERQIEEIHVKADAVKAAPHLNALRNMFD